MITRKRLRGISTNNRKTTTYFMIIIGTLKSVVPILQAFIKMSTTHKIPMHFINMTTDYCMLRRPEFMQQMIQQRQLDLLLQCAYMEHSRTLARDMEYIQSKFS